MFVWIYVGSYDSTISRFRRDALGILTGGEVVAQLPNASWLELHPDGRTLYAVSETAGGSVAAFRVGDSGLDLLGQQSSGGDDPCHLALDAQGRFLIVANYSSGTVAVLPVSEDGSLAEATDVVQLPGEGPHAHQVVFAGDEVLIADLGNDEIRRFVLRDGRLQPAATPVATAPAGCGPRHLVRRQDNFYVAAELDSTVLAYDADLRLVEAKRSTAAAQSWPSGLVLSPGGDHLYVGNRGPDTIGVFRVAGLELIAEVPTGGVWPRDITFVDGRLYVANERSGDVTVFEVDQHSGIPVQIGRTETPAPARVL